MSKAGAYNHDSPKARNFGKDARDVHAEAVVITR
jgi:hypothetical protein